MTLAVSALMLTLNELSRDQLAYVSPPNAPGVGALVLLALILVLGWLISDTHRAVSANRWAKTGFALAASLPPAWIATSYIVMRKLDGIPDGDTPAGLVDRMNADVSQMQFAALLVTLAIVACIALAHRNRHEA